MCRIRRLKGLRFRTTGARYSSASATALIAGAQRHEYRVNAYMVGTLHTLSPCNGLLYGDDCIPRLITVGRLPSRAIVGYGLWRATFRDWAEGHLSHHTQQKLSDQGLAISGSH
jgi:hypothetical protein